MNVRDCGYLYIDECINACCVVLVCVAIVNVNVNMKDCGYA